jgi:hypothetical protein
LRVRHVKLNIGYNIAVGIQHHVAELGGLTANIAAEKRGGGRKHQAAVVEHTGRYVDCAELTKRNVGRSRLPLGARIRIYAGQMERVTNRVESARIDNHGAAKDG